MSDKCDRSRDSNFSYPWMEAMLLAFRRYMLPPTSGWKCVKWASFCVCTGSCSKDNEKRGRVSASSGTIRIFDWKIFAKSYWYRQGTNTHSVHCSSWNRMPYIHRSLPSLHIPTLKIKVKYTSETSATFSASNCLPTQLKATAYQWTPVKRV